MQFNEQVLYLLKKKTNFLCCSLTLSIPLNVFMSRSRLDTECQGLNFHQFFFFSYKFMKNT